MSKNSKELKNIGESESPKKKLSKKGETDEQKTETEEKDDGNDNGSSASDKGKGGQLKKKKETEKKSKKDEDENIENDKNESNDSKQNDKSEENSQKKQNEENKESKENKEDKESKEESKDSKEESKESKDSKESKEDKKEKKEDKEEKKESKENKKKEKNKENKESKSEDQSNDEVKLNSSESDNKKDSNESKQAEEVVSLESDKKNDENKDPNKSDNQADKKKLIQKKRRARRISEGELLPTGDITKKKKERERDPLEDSDIISIHEEEEKIMNSSYEPKSDNKYLSTPFGKLLQISQEYGFTTVMDRIISFINTNESASSKYGVGISKDIKDILKRLNKETLNLYLIKLCAYNQKKNFKILNDYKMSNDKKFVKYMRKRREGKDPLADDKSEEKENKISDDDSGVTDDDKDKINTGKELEEEIDEEDSQEFEKRTRNKKGSDDDDEDGEGSEKIDRRRGTDLHDNVQYRSRHFQWKNGILHSYVPKINLKATRFYLYCWKMGCKGKVRVDMNNKTAKEYGEHMEHRGVILDNFKDEYPELAAKDWEHIQYDVKNGEKILMWKY